MCLPLWASLFVAMHDDIKTSSEGNEVPHSIRSGTITERNDVRHSIRSGRSILLTVVLLS